MGNNKAKPNGQKQASAKSQKRRQARKPFWYNPLVWLGGIGTVVVGGVLVNVLSSQAQRVIPPPTSTPASVALSSSPDVNSKATVTGKRSGPPVRIDSVVTNTGLEGFGYIFPQRLVLSTAELTYLNRLSPNDPRYDSWFTSRGAASVSPAVFKLVVEGNRSRPVQIVDMGYTDQCTRPLDGSYYGEGQAGGTEEDQAVVFDLDAKHPFPQNGMVTGNFFAAHSISLKEGEVEVFKVVVNSSRYCQYRLTLSVVDGTKTVTEVVSDHGRPFHVTASENLPRKSL
jgi:hypothetical protein